MLTLKWHFQFPQDSIPILIPVEAMSILKNWEIQTGDSLNSEVDCG